MENRKKYTANQNTQPTGSMGRIHGSRLDLVPMVRISGNLPPHLQSEADLPFHMQGSASPSGEPICALMDSVTSTYSIARVDSLGGDEDG
jgi:hypothetical protein